MSDRSVLLKKLSTHLAQEVVLLGQVFSALEKEHQYLSEKALEQLSSAVANKSAALSEFEQAVAIRMDTLAELGLDLENTPHSHSLKLIQECGNELPEILAHWSTLESLLQQCQEQNAINGAIIEISSHSLQTAYSILTAPTSGTPNLYDAKGISRKGSGTGNSLAKA